MRKSFSALIAGALLALGITGCHRGEPVDLKLQPAPGTRYRNIIETRMVMDQTFRGQTLQIINDLVMETTYEVGPPAGEDHRITGTFTRVAMDASNKTSEKVNRIRYDSRDTAGADTTFAGVADMLHKPFTMIITGKGEIKSIEGLQQMMGAPGGQELMSSALSDSSIWSMMQQSLHFFPDKPVRPGNSWKKSFTTFMPPLTMRVDNTYKLESVKNGIAYISVKAKVTSAGLMMEGVQQMQIGLEGEQKGTMEVEVATGLITDCRLSQKSRGSVNVMGQIQIPMNISSEVHLTGKKL